MLMIKIFQFKKLLINVIQVDLLFYLDGKKEYKVIWSGLTFKEATWEPE